MPNRYISVILPVFNAESYIERAVQSILSQTFRDFELICIDDGSSDSSLDILKQFHDPRIRLYTRENRGLIPTLNEGLTYARYRYIARMDADDISLPERFEKQIQLMDRYGLGVVGSSYEYIDKTDQPIGSRKLSRLPFLNSWLLDFGSSFCHPSVIFDRDILGSNLWYDTECSSYEDYELWLRLRSAGIRMANTPEILFKYRILDSSISRTMADLQSSGSATALCKYSEFLTKTDDCHYMLLGRKSRVISISTLYKKLRLSFLALRQFGFFRALFVFVYLLR